MAAFFAGILFGGIITVGIAFWILGLLFNFANRETLYSDPLRYSHQGGFQPNPPGPPVDINTVPKPTNSPNDRRGASDAK